MLHNFGMFLSVLGGKNMHVPEQHFCVNYTLNCFYVCVCILCLHAGRILFRKATRVKPHSKESDYQNRMFLSVCGQGTKKNLEHKKRSEILDLKSSWWWCQQVFWDLVCWNFFPLRSQERLKQVWFTLTDVLSVFLSFSITVSLLDSRFQELWHRDHQTDHQKTIRASECQFSKTQIS